MSLPLITESPATYRIIRKKPPHQKLPMNLTTMAKSWMKRTMTNMLLACNVLIRRNYASKPWDVSALMRTESLNGSILLRKNGVSCRSKPSWCCHANSPEPAVYHIDIREELIKYAAKLGKYRKPSGADAHELLLLTAFRLSDGPWQT